MKKLLLSVAALVFATLLFSQKDSSDAHEDLPHDTVAKVEMRVEAAS